ncbi:IMPACT family protein [Ornithinimicrobium avium]|uniref:YigZ family protein n=1 Tax=Ornithinimicrobium avium TaxID=2283195 RepID=A0A345NMK2_9MICO|nr:YigZ family protein [Ornithinimicrobium avium]AXH96260.1 YigZ family protein [Ornithinimicrobium avium]
MDPAPHRPTSYRTVAAPVVASIEEKRSLFECWLRRAEDEPGARAVVEEARVTHWDARHHCSAFVLGPEGALVRSNDDGEPAGTAGTPMLEVLTGAGLTDVVAVVTRWFGGTLLGTGGLVRAYSDAVRAALAEARVLTRVRVGEVDVRVSHATAGRLEHDLRARGVAVPDVRYGEHVTLRVQVPVAERDELAGLLASLTSGEAELVAGSEAESWLDGPG